MPSLDFIRDITDELKKQDINYLIVTVQRGSKKAIIDVFNSIPDLFAVDCFIDRCEAVLTELKKARAKELAKKKPNKKKSNEH